MFEIRPPRTTAALRDELEALALEIERSLEDLSTEEFVESQGEHWSPAEHIRHLMTAVRAVAQGMSLPRWVLALRFGVSRRGSRSFEEVRRDYQGALEAGGRATGRYDPSKRKIDMELDELRAFLVGRWRTANEELAEAIGSWSEKALDRYRAKHPLLGMMTARELLYFTLYHNAHHARRVHERRVPGPIRRAQRPEGRPEAPNAT